MEDHERTSFQIGDTVVYIPGHADGPHHKDCERGVVVHPVANGRGTIFVRFLRNSIWQSTAEGCDMDDLLHEPKRLI